MPHNVKTVKKMSFYNVWLAGGELYKQFDTLDDAIECVMGFQGVAYVERFSWEGGRLFVLRFSDVSYVREIVY